MSAAARVTLALFALAAALRSSAQEESIGVAVRLDRDTVYLHEQAVFALEIHHPRDARASWEAPPFDGFWAERIGTRALPDDPSGLRRTEFRRALFPTRTGDVLIAPSRLVLEGESGGERAIAVPGAVVHVRPLPAGVGAETLVGRLEIHLTTPNDHVALGKSATIAFELSGDANVWDAAAPAIESLVGPEVEVFPEPPHVSIGEDSGHATTRRTFRYALVPSRAGSLSLPPIELRYFDPRAGELRTAKSEGLRFEVLETGASHAAQGASAGRAAPPPLDPRLVWLGAGALGLTALALVLTRSRRRSAPAAPARVMTPAALRSAFDAALAARGQSDFPLLLARAVRSGVEARHRCDALLLTTAEIAERVDDPEAVELLQLLDRARFGGASLDDDSLLERARRYLAL